MLWLGQLTIADTEKATRLASLEWLDPYGVARPNPLGHHAHHRIINEVSKQSLTALNT